MTGTIPQDIIEQVRQANDITDIIGDYIRLKKRGRNYTALCPFHVEKTPSFSVSPDKQIFYCFGCQKGGNVFTFLMEHEKMAFVEAVRFLARRAGITIPERKMTDSSREELEKLQYAQEVAMEYFKSVLYSDQYRNDVLGYVMKKRRLSDDTIKLFQIGFAGSEWDGFLNHALKKGFFPKELAKAGLVVYSEKHDKYFDRFRQRLMIPIFNLSGKPIAFGGRTLSKEEQAKYINSPETMLYSKSNVLYGLNFSRQFIREKNEVIIVEGYFDFISLYQAGIRNVVASSGTAFTPQQARLLARFAEMAYLFFDADSAGQGAALRSVDALYDAGLEVMVMIPPEGEDPDSVAVKEGVAGIESIKSKALRYLEFRIKDIDTKKLGIIAKDKIIKELAELAGRINDPTRRQLFIDEAAMMLQINPRSLQSLLPTSAKESKRPLEIRSPKKIIDIERDLLSLMISFPDYIETVSEKVAPDDFQSKSFGRIYTHILSVYMMHEAVTVNNLIDNLDEKSLVAELASLAKIDWKGQDAQIMVSDYINKILYFKRERIIDRLKGELKIAEEKGDVATARQLIEEIAELIKRRRE